MSMAKCDFCDWIFSTDVDPESTIFMADKFVCEECREQLENDLEQEEDTLQ